MILEKDIVELFNSSFREIDNCKSKNIKLRNYKIKLRDAIYYKFMYSKNETTKESIVSSLNYDNNTSINKSSYYRKENNIPIDLYKNIFLKIKDKYNDLLNNNNLNELSEKLVLAVDGTFNNTNINNFSDTIETSLNMGYYDILKDVPLDIDFKGPNKKNTELNQLEDYIKEKNLKNTIIVADRAYYKYEFFKNLNDSNLNYIIRIKDNSYLINNDNCPKKYKNITLIDQLKKSSRIIECEYKKEKKLKSKNNKEIKINQTLKYYLITNLSDTKTYTNDKIKDIYNSRWKIEIFFKLLKSNFKFSYLVEKKREQNEKLIFSELIVVYICKILKYYILSIKNKNKIVTKRKTKEKIKVNININESNIIKGIYDKLLKDIIYSQLKEEKIKVFLKTYVNITQNEQDRQFPRVCKCPFKKWYIKAYHEIYKYNKINDAIKNNTTEKLNKNLKLMLKNIKIEIT